MKTFVQFFLMLCWSVGFAYGGEIFQLQPYSREIKLSGFTRPVKLITISAETSGRCHSVLVETGDEIPAAGVVAQLDDTFVLLDLEKNRISQEQARRQLEEETKNLARYRALINNKSTPQATYDEAALRADLYGYALQSLKIEEDYLRELLERHVVRAPADWLVTQRFAEPGEFVRQGEPILEVGDFRQLVVNFLLTQKELVSLQSAVDIILHFPESNLEVPAELHRVSPLYDSVSKKTEVELRIDSKTPILSRGGLYCLLKIPAGRVENQFVVPAAALISRYEAHWLKTADGKLHKVILLEYLDDGLSAVITGDKLASEQSYEMSPANEAPQ